MLIKSPCITTHASFLKSNDITGLLMIKQTIAHQYLERTPPKCLSSIEIEIVKKDCLELAQSIKAARGSVCVLNFANQFIVGGDYLNLSALAQEESIIRRTNLLDSLIQLDGVIPGNVANPYKYALPDCLGFDNAYQRSGFGEFTALYSPEITVGVLDLNTRKNISPFQIDVISSAAYNLSFAEESPDPALYMAGTVFKIINQFRTAKLHGQRNLVLGAFGCGAFQNSPTTIAEMYCAVLNEYEFQGCFDTIYFAITDHLNSENYAAFSNIFSSVKIKTVHDLLKDTFSLESMPHFLEEQLSAFSKIDTLLLSGNTFMSPTRIKGTPEISRLYFFMSYTAALAENLSESWSLLVEKKKDLEISASLGFFIITCWDLRSIFSCPIEVLY